MKAFWVCAVSKVQATFWHREASNLSDVSSLLREFGIASPCKHTAQPRSWPPAAQAHISCHLKEAHQKASFKETPQAAVFEEAQTKAFATRAFRASPGQANKRQCSPGNPFFLPSAPLPAKDNFAGSSARTAQLGQMKLELLFLAVGSSAPVFAVPHQGSYCRALRTQIRQRKSSLDSLVTSSSSCGSGLGSPSHKALSHRGCPALTSASLWMVPRAAGSVRSEEDKYTPHQVQPKCQHTNASRHPTSHLSHPNPFKASPPQCFWSTDSLQAQHRLFRWGNSIVILFSRWCKCHISTWVITNNWLWTGHVSSLSPACTTLHPVLALITENNKSS